MHGSIEIDKAARLRAARDEAYATPLKDFHPGAPRLFRDDTLWPWFERLRAEEPVHYCTNAPIEPYWSVTKYHDIMHVDTSHQIFSSDQRLGGISIRAVHNDVRGRIDPAEVAATIRTAWPRTNVVCLENTHNRCGGAAIAASISVAPG